MAVRRLDDLLDETRCRVDLEARAKLVESGKEWICSAHGWIHLLGARGTARRLEFGIAGAWSPKTLRGPEALTAQPGHGHRNGYRSSRSETIASSLP